MLLVAALATLLVLLVKQGWQASPIASVDMRSLDEYQQESLRQLMHVASTGDATAVKQALQSTGSITPDALLHALHVATEMGYDEIAELLIENGASVDGPSDSGFTPLHVASIFGHNSLVRLLLSKGADPSARIGAGHTGLHLSVDQGHLTVLRELLQDGRASTEVRNEDGYTALHLACAHGLHGADAASMLIAHGADANAASPEGITPLYAAVFAVAQAVDGRSADTPPRLQQLLEELLGARANPDAANKALATPLDAAAFLGLDDVLRTLRGAARQGSKHGTGGEDGGASGDAARRHALQARHGREQRARMATARSVREPAAVTLANISVAVSDASTTASTAVSPLWLERALDLWRQHGVVVFPALVPSTEVERLKTYLFAMRRDGGRGARDRSASIRSPLHREMKGMAVVRSSSVISSMGKQLAPFLRAALGSSRQLLLESNYMATLPGADAQEWHADCFSYDDRLAAVQIALVDTAVDQGALEVRPGSHLSADAEEKEEAVAVAVPAGTVTLYSPSIVHRGRANLHPSAPRLSLTFTILGAGGLLPTGIPYAGQPEDEWRWSLVNGELRDEWRP